MAVGDAINGISTANPVFSFQPAGTNAFVITSAYTWGGNISLTNGVISTRMEYSSTLTNTTNTKYIINNTNYITQFSAGADGANYMGVQIK